MHLLSQPCSGWQPPQDISGMVFCFDAFSSRERDHLAILARGRLSLEEAIGGQHMASEDDDKPRKKVTHEIGQDLSLLSVEELNERIALMSSEIERLQQAATKKRASKDAANSFFKS
jgi:uncharacterized small protein (DUF1192 family)